MKKKELPKEEDVNVYEGGEQLSPEEAQARID